MASLTPHKIKNKKKFFYVPSAFFLFFVVAGFLFPHSALAYFGLSDIGPSMVKAILNPFFILMGWFVGGAVTIFGWAIDPSIYGADGLFNKASTYTSWKFIRDFFNLFFILTLLYTAFTIVFQVAANYKKTLLSIVLAALFVNFSFPITRVIIDVANVPMYYFINLMLGEGGSSNTISSSSKILGPALDASSIKNKLIPGSGDGGNVVVNEKVSITQLLTATVFLFMFAITLMVVAILMVVRVVALIMLVIFSAVGFAGSIIPGMKKYSDMWWDSLLKYALFGPTMLLMLYIAVQLFAEVSTMNAAIKDVTAVNAPTGQGDFFSTMVSFAITLIMMWMSIIVASTSSVAGAGIVGGFGQKAMKWAGKKTYRGATYPVRKFSSGVGQGAKTRFNDSKFGKFFAGPSRLEAYGKGIGKTVGKENIIDVGKSAQKEYRTEQEKFHTKRVGEEEKRMGEERTSDSQLRSIIAAPHNESKETVEAAVRLLSKRGGFQNSAQLTQGLAAIDVANAGNPAAQAEKRAEVIKTADKELFRDATSLVSALSHLTGDTKSMIQLIDKVEAKGFDGMTTAQYNSLATDHVVKDRLDQKLKKEGHSKVLIDADIAGSLAGPGGVPPARPPMARQAAYDKHLGGMSAEDLGKVKGIHGDAGHPADAELVSYVTDQVATSNWTPKEWADAYSKLGAEQKAAWRAAGINP